MRHNPFNNDFHQYPAYINYLPVNLHNKMLDLTPFRKNSWNLNPEILKPYEEIQKNIQLWYAKGRGKAFQEDLAYLSPKWTQQ